MYVHTVHWIAEGMVQTEYNSWIGNVFLEDHHHHHLANNSRKRLTLHGEYVSNDDEDTQEAQVDIEIEYLAAYIYKHTSSWSISGDGSC